LLFMRASACTSSGVHAGAISGLNL
jgi:hypothetical protein